MDRLSALDYLLVASPSIAARYFPNGVSRSALLKAPAVAFDHLDDMHQSFLQQNFDLSPGSVLCYIVNSSEAFVQLARQGTTCCMISHLQIERELEQRELIDLTPGLYQRRMLYWHRFAPESRMMRKVTDTLLDHGHQAQRQAACALWGPSRPVPVSRVLRHARAACGGTIKALLPCSTPAGPARLALLRRVALRAGAVNHFPPCRTAIERAR